MEIVHVVFFPNGSMQGVYSGRDTAQRFASWVDGYITTMELDPHLIPFGMR